MCLEVHYSATHGAQRFDRSGECGLLILETEEGVWVRVVLESFTLADRVLEAMALARSRSLDIGNPVTGGSCDARHGACAAPRSMRRGPATV